MTLIFLDGSNVAHENHETISAARLETALNYLEKFGYKSHAILTKFKIRNMRCPEIIDKLVKEERLTIIPNDEDETLIDLAIEKDAFILTNDRFKDHKKKDWWSPEIEERLIPYNFVEGYLSIIRSKRHCLDNHLKNSPI